MKVAVGLSGGVDSCVAALLLKRAGHDVTGVTMTLGRPNEAAAVASARAAAERLGLPFLTFDFAATWQRDVLGDARATYRAGETPNPCVRCNERIKFGLLPERVFESGFERFATGHYARTEDGRLFRGADRTKDQSYFLYRVPRDILARTLFPLGSLTKAEVREIAEAAGLPSASASDSQDFCGGGVDALFGCDERPGDVVTREGRVLGHHTGFWHFTIGQRKGLGTGGGGTPYYVTALDAAANRVIVGTRDEAARTSFPIRDGRWLAPDVPFGGTFAARVKVRSAGAMIGPVAVDPAPDGRTAQCRSATPILGVAPGQSAVFYAPATDEVLGGGIIAQPPVV